MAPSLYWIHKDEIDIDLLTPGITTNKRTAKMLRHHLIIAPKHFTPPTVDWIYSSSWRLLCLLFKAPGQGRVSLCQRNILLVRKWCWLCFQAVNERGRMRSVYKKKQNVDSQVNLGSSHKHQTFTRTFPGSTLGLVTVPLKSCPEKQVWWQLFGRWWAQRDRVS